MGAARAWTTISGQTPASVVIAVVGQEATRTVYFDPDFARVEVDSGVSPPRAKITTSTVQPLQIAALQEALTALAARVTTLEAQRLTITTLKTANYTAVAWDHVLVNLAAAAGNVTITMPTSPAPTVGDRVRVSDISTTGGIPGKRLLVAATFAPSHYATSPYAVGDIGAGQSIIGANADLVYTAAGWYVVGETVEPEQLL